MNLSLILSCTLSCVSNLKAELEGERVEQKNKNNHKEKNATIRKKEKEEEEEEKEERHRSLYRIDSERDRYKHIRRKARMT